MLRSGFGARTAKALSSTIGAGKQNIADRSVGADAVVRAIGGEDIATWLDAESIVIFHGDGEAISSWTAKVGNSTATQSTSGKRPTLDVDGFNGRPAVKFDNSNDVLHWAAGGLIDANIPANTLIAVNTTANDGGNAMLFEMGTAYQNDDNLAQYYNGVNKFVSGMGAASGTDEDEGTSTSTCPDILNVCISTFDRTPNPNVIETYINSEPCTITGAEEGNSGATTDWENNPAYLGARNNGASLPFNGHIREFLVLTRALTAAEAFRIGLALMNKSGVTLKYVAQVIKRLTVVPCRFGFQETN